MYIIKKKKSITMIPEGSVWHNLRHDDIQKEKFSVKINMRMIIQKICYFLPRPKHFFLLSVTITIFQEPLIHTGCKAMALPEILRKIKLNIWIEVLMKNLIQIPCLIFLKISGMAAALMDGLPPLYLPKYRMNFS